jgi:DNA-binding NtrC family response regulator
MRHKQKRSVLVVDDDAGMLRALDRVLTNQGWQVTCARWIDEAMEHLARQHGQFSLIITDLRMPVVSGKTILSAVNTAFPRIPVIIITAFGSPETKAECLRQGAAAFLEKPLDSTQLLAAIDAARAAATRAGE